MPSERRRLYIACWSGTDRFRHAAGKWLIALSTQLMRENARYAGAANDASISASVKPCFFHSRSRIASNAVTALGRS